MKLYLKLVINIAVLIFSFGYALPFLISYPDTILVLGGVLYGAVLLPAFMYYFNKKQINLIMEKVKNEF